MNRKTRRAAKIYKQTGEAILAFCELLVPPRYAAAPMRQALEAADAVFVELPHARRMFYLNLVNRHVQAFNVLARPFRTRVDPFTLAEVALALDPGKHSRVAAVLPSPSTELVGCGPRKQAVYDPS